MKNKQAVLKQRGSTLFLRLAVIGIWSLTALLCFLVLPAIHREWLIEFPYVTYMRYPVIIALTLAAFTLMVALRQVWRLLNYVDKNTVFSGAAVRALRNIKRCGFIISGLFVGAMPLVYYIADKDDAPGMILFGMMLVAAPIVVAVFAGIAQQLLQSAIDFKAENDLTV